MVFGNVSAVLAPSVQGWLCKPFGLLRVCEPGLEAGFVVRRVRQSLSLSRRLKLPLGEVLS